MLFRENEMLFQENEISLKRNSISTSLPWQRSLRAIVALPGPLEDISNTLLLVLTLVISDNTISTITKLLLRTVRSTTFALL